MHRAEIMIDDQQVIALHGRIDMKNVVDIYAKMTEMLLNVPQIQIDLSNIKSADSSSLILLIECVRYAKAQNKSIVFYHIPQFISDLGRVCGVDKILPINTALTFH